MNYRGSNRCSRKEQLDAYAAMVCDQELSTKLTLDPCRTFVECRGGLLLLLGIWCELVVYDSSCVRGETESHTFGIGWQAILCNYFEAGGASAQLILPKQLALQYLLLCQKPPPRTIADPDDDAFYDFVDDDDDF